MYKYLKHFINETKAAAAVEFALIAPVLTLLIVGVADIGFLVLERMQIENAAQTAAEYVSQAQGDDNMLLVFNEFYQGNAANVTLSSNFACTCSDGIEQACPVDCGNAGDYQRRFINVAVNGNFTPLFDYPGLPSSIPISGEARARVD